MKTITKTLIAYILVGILMIPGVVLAKVGTSEDVIDEGTDAAANYETQKQAEVEIKNDAEKVCQDKYGTSCQGQADKLRMTSGQGFKLPLDFLTLETKDKNGKVQKQGTSFFYNKDYSKYGVLLGTLLRVIDILIYVIGSVALLTLVVAGIMMIANHGDEGWVTKGKDMMLYSILGVLFALLSFAVVNVITSILS